MQKRLRRIEGQVRGLRRMVGEDASCIEVLTRMSAATKALESVALHLLEARGAAVACGLCAARGQEATPADTGTSFAPQAQV